MYRGEEGTTVVIGVRLERSGVSTYVDPREETFEKGEGVIITTERGLEHATVCMGNLSLPSALVPESLPTLLRRASAEDETSLAENRRCAAEAVQIAETKVAQHGLDMKLVGSEFTFDRDKLIFYFTAEGRVDFRSLVRDLAQTFHTRIELRQIGVRDQARMIGGLGSCGQPLCCRRFMNDFVPVSIKMAKTQGLSLNPTKISGACGRLMCCLNYEQDHYLQNTKRVPMKGTLVRTQDGQGYVVDRDVLQTRIRVHLYKPDGTEDERYYPVSDVEVLERRKKGESRPALRTQEELNAKPFVTEGEKHPMAEEPPCASVPCRKPPCAKRRVEKKESFPSEKQSVPSHSWEKPFPEGDANRGFTLSVEMEQKTEWIVETRETQESDPLQESPDRASAESYAKKGRVKPKPRRGRPRKRR